MYPSISICKKYSFEYEMFNEDDFEGVNDTDDVSSRVESMIKNFSYYSLDLDDQVYFFSQPGVMNMTYPCTTTLAGTSPGRPCIFPVRWKFTLPAKYALYYGYDYINVTNCKPWDADVAAYLGRTFKHLGGGRCYTKAYENNTVDSNTGSDAFWGVCPPSCKGEVLSPSSPYNLAKQKYVSLWRSALYDLDGFDNGLCHTYNPPENSEIDFSKRIFFMIPRNLNHYQDYDIFLHERGQFWPRSDMISYGQQESVTITNNTELQISFSIKKVKKISTEERPCVMDEEYSFTTCLQEYVIKQTNCSLNLFGQESKKTKICSKKAFDQYYDLLMNIGQDRISKIKQESGCYPKCRVTKYSFEKIERPMNWNSAWSSEVFVQAASSEVEYSEEYYTFDENDLISSVGGNMGLFLGWSVLTLVEAIGFLIVVTKVEKYFRKFA